MRVLVCGGRDYDDKEFVYRTLDAFHLLYGIHLVIEGGAYGADALAADWANENGIKKSTFEAEWSKHGRAAGPIRNERMLKEGNPDVVIAFSGGRGTQSMKSLARASGVSVIEVTS